MSRANYHHLSSQQVYGVRQKMTAKSGYLVRGDDPAWDAEAAKLGLTGEQLYQAVLRQKTAKFRRNRRLP